MRFYTFFFAAVATSVRSVVFCKKVFERILIIFRLLLKRGLRFDTMVVLSVKGTIMQEETNVSAVESAEGTSSSQDGEKLSNRNLFMYALGTLGRDFLYNLFNGYLLSFCVFTKNLNTAQFTAITFIIVAARIFDALNDPIMGGIVENTRTKWGKYKPWQLIGALTTSVVIVTLFTVPAQGWGFIGLLAAMYFLFSITFTMNDISYWGMMPSLTNNPHDRDKLMTFTSVSVGIGGGLAGLIIPTFAMGEKPVGGNSTTAFGIMAVIAVVLMCGFQMFTIFGVKEKPLPKNLMKTPPMKVKDMFRVLFKNDQIMWSALVMLLFNVGTNVVGGGLGMMYIYFDNAYNGTLWTVFGVGYAVVSTVFTLFYPAFAKKFGRDKLLYSCGLALIIGYGLMMVFGLTVPKTVLFEVLNMKITLRFILTFLAYTIAGWGGGFYMIMVINMANTVEYNEYKTGRRDEGLIFALRPFTAKMGSALMQGLVSLVYIVAGVLTYTNQFADIDKGLITDMTKQDVVDALQASTGGQQSTMILLVCTCAIPMVFMAVALIVYKKKFFLNETKMNEMIAAIEARKAAEEAIETEEAQEEMQEIESELKLGNVEKQEEQAVDEILAVASDNSQDIENDIQ